MLCWSSYLLAPDAFGILLLNKLLLLPTASIVAEQIRPIICDLSCRYGDSLSTSIFKAEKIIGISYEFEGGNIGSLDEITLKNGLGKTELIKRSLDGKRGYVTFGNFPAVRPN